MSEIIESLKASMQLVHGGTFDMGDLNGLYKPSLFSSCPKIGYTKIMLDDYHICSHPVTNAEWAEVIGEEVSGNPDYPKTGITWHQALTFIRKLNEITGWDFRLPTEAEWEYAARGGEFSKGDPYAGGNILDTVGWYAINSERKIKPVCQLDPNQLGLYDMSGNVYEWCADIYDRTYPRGESMGFFSSVRKPIHNPKGAQSGNLRVVRGGSFKCKDYECWVFFRNKKKSTDSAIDCGFRLAY